MEKSVTLSESQAIAKYIDRVAPGHPLELSRDVNELGILPEKVWEFVSLVASFGFPTLEGGVIKPYVKAVDEGKGSSFKHGDDALKQARKLLKILESLMQPNTKFAFGEHPTWADLFLYPQLADLRAIPSWSELADERIIDWMFNMDGLEAVELTKPGTLAVGGRP